MNKRILGRTGIEVSEVAFGCVEIGMPYGIGVNSEADMLSQSEAVQLLQSALGRGINFYDTARYYGNSEALLGLAFSDKRSQVVIATKCVHIQDGTGNLLPPADLKSTVLNSLEASLAAIQTDYIDVFMLHQASKEILEDPSVAEIFQLLKKEGRIRATGISTYTNEETRLAIESGNWDVIQVPFNLMDQRQQQLFELAKKKGVALVARSILLKGLLSDRATGLHPALAAIEQHIQLYPSLLSTEDDQEAISDLPSLATKFALSFPEISAVLVGIDRMEYLDQAIATANGHYLNFGKLQAAQRLAYPEPDFINLYQWHVNGWLL